MDWNPKKWFYTRLFPAESFMINLRVDWGSYATTFFFSGVMETTCFYNNNKKMKRVCWVLLCQHAGSTNLAGG